MYLLLILGLLCTGLAFVGICSDKLPDGVCLKPSEQEIMHKLVWDLEIAEKHFDEAVTQGEIEAAAYERMAVQKRLENFRRWIK